MADRLIPLKTDGTLPALVVEAVQDILGAALVAGTNVTSVVYNDAAGTVTINAATQAGGGGGGLDAEAVQDTVAAMIVAGTGITATYNDGAGTLTLTASGGGGGGSVQDTGVRDVRSWVTNTTIADTSPADSKPNHMHVSRVGSQVSLSFDCVTDGVGGAIFTVPVGWRPTANTAAGLSPGSVDDYINTSIRVKTDGAGVTTGGSGRRIATLTYTTTDAWPGTLPGTAVT